jgi:exopolyphosphatase/guanosine-5'-triphosphate,3'-diphosphate pyrophosphatase
VWPGRLNRQQHGQVGAPSITPRWEWRSFGAGFGAAEATLTALTPDEVVESAELYLVSAEGRDVVKVRDDVMDVKQLLRVDDDVLEQWAPLLKAPFPLAPDVVSAVAGALGVPEPPPVSYSLAALLADVVAPNPHLRAVEVRKRRTRFQLGGCLAELTDVDTDRYRVRTLAVEAEDPQRVVGTLRELGLSTRPNLHFGRALRILERFGAERFAVIDVGTNSVKLHIGDRHVDGSWRTVVDRAVVTRLGEGLGQSGRLGPEPMARTVEAITGMVEEARRLRVGAVAAVGTAGLRASANAAEFIATVDARCGVLVEVISGEEEARLAYRAATAALPVPGSSVVFDTGGGSSQFSIGEGGRVEEQFSVPVGAARFTEEFGLDGRVSPERLDEVRAAIASDLARLDGRPAPDALIGMGGAITNLAAVRHGLAEYDADVVQGTVLDRDEIDRQIELYRSRDAVGRRSLVGLQPSRAEVILAGALIVRTVLDRLGADSLTVSDRGLRYGVLAERFGLDE